MFTVKKSLLMAIMCLMVGVAQAGGLLEIRGGAGMTASDPDSFEDQANAAGNGGLSTDDLETFHADAFFNIPAFPIGVGLRHEWLNQDDSSSGSSYDLNVKNVTLLVDWRIIDTGIYVGPIVGIGYPWADLDFNSGSTSVSEQIDGDQISYSAGLEAGVILGRFLVGAEAGYQSIELKQANSSTLSSTVDLSGFYGKAMVGITLF